MVEKVTGEATESVSAASRAMAKGAFISPHAFELNSKATNLVYLIIKKMHRKKIPH